MNRYKFKAELDQCNADLKALEAENEQLKQFDCRKILLEVVPGDGNGLEVYAKSLEDVEKAFEKLANQSETAQLDCVGLREKLYWQGKELDSAKSRMGLLRRMLSRRYGIGANAFIVWNEAKTEGFVTTDSQLAYEVRKSSDSNCFDAEGKRSKVGLQFCEEWGDGNCTIQEGVADQSEVVSLRGELAEIKDSLAYRGSLLCRIETERDRLKAERDAFERSEAASSKTAHELEKELAALRAQEQIFIVFDGPPGNDAPRFVEVETSGGISVRLGDWQERPDGYWILGPCYAAPQSSQPTKQTELPKEPTT